jgi:hypothetical protein
MSHKIYITVESVPVAQGSANSLIGVALTILPDAKIDDAARPWSWSNISWTVWGSKDRGVTWATTPNQVIALPNGDDSSGDWKETVDSAWTSSHIQGLEMHAQFIPPDDTGTIPATLWLNVQPPPIPLVSDWQAHIYEMLAPFLDVAHVLTGLDEPLLRPALGDSFSDWRVFRKWVITSLLDLASPLFAQKPNQDHWYDLLRSNPALKDALGTDPKELPTLNNPESVLPFGFSHLNLNLATIIKTAPRPYDVEILELKTVVAAVTSEPVLRSLEDLGSVPKVVPAALLTGNRTGALLTWLQIQLAKPYAAVIASACNASSTDFADVASRLWKSVVLDYLTGHKPVATAPQDPWVNQVIAACNSGLEPQLAATLKARALGITQSSSAARTNVAPPLVIPVLNMQTSGGDLKSDPMYKVRGVAILLRRTSDGGGVATKWTCPNIVAPLLDSGNGRKRPLLVAKRLDYSRNLLNGFITYDNGPLACETVLHDYMVSEGSLLKSTAGSDSQNAIAAIIRYVPFEDSFSPFFGTAMLECGSSYSVLCFAISNCGALPVELRDNYPAKLKLPAATDPAPYTPSGPFPYYRTVPVGGAEVRDEDGKTLTNADGFFPGIPENVFLRSTQVKAPAGTTTLLLAPTQSTWGTRVVSATQAVPSRFVFSLKLPSVEPQTWDRSVAHAIDKALRAQILNAAYTKLAKNQKADMITDPLIDAISISLSDEAGNELGKLPYTTQLLNVAGGVDTYPLQVLVDAGTGRNDGSVRVGVLNASTPAATVLAGTLKEGEIYLLTATCDLNPNVDKLMPGYATSRRLPAYELLIEIASANLPEPKDVFGATQVVASDALPNRILSATLLAGQQNWKTIHRVDFLRQAWYWTGRIQPRTTADFLDPGYFPAAEPLDALAVEKWESVEFSERPWTDHVELPTVLQDGAFVWTENMTLESRAAFFRFAPRIYSRYQGAFAQFAEDGVTTVGNSGNDLWKSCFMRTCAQTLNAPRLKALIPMTESAFVEGTPGVLAVFDGPAYDQAGLAERLNVSIAEASDPDRPVTPPSATTSPRRWTQAGPDFLMSAEPVSGSPEGQVTVELVAIGPIGHTFDDPSSYFPKFSSSSWIIRPRGTHNFSWWFANLEFTLSIDRGSSVYKGVEIVSHPSIGSWIQFLPGFQSADHEFNLLAKWSLELNGASIKIYDQDNKLVSAPLRKDERHTGHYLLVTRRVIDVTGKSREAYVGVAQYDSNHAWTLLAGRVPPDRAELRCRFMDIRAGDIAPNNAGPNSDVDFWTRIFGNDKITDASRSSIVSLSPVVSGKRGAQ